MIFEKPESLPKMRILALGHETKRIDVAVSDELKMIFRRPGPLRNQGARNR